MAWKSRLHELGISPLGGETFSPLSETDLEMIEERVGRKLPDEFREFLSQFGECDFEEYAVFPTGGGGSLRGRFSGRPFFLRLKTLLKGSQFRLSQSMMMVPET